MPASWEGVNNDPSAGVVLWPREIKCPRCGVAKHGAGARHGLCRDCSDVLGRDRAAWAA